MSDLFGRHYLATFVETALWTGMMRTHRFTTIRAITHSWNADRIMSATHLALGRAGFSLWNCHIHLLCSQLAHMPVVGLMRSSATTLPRRAKPKQRSRHYGDAAVGVKFAHALKQPNRCRLKNDPNKQTFSISTILQI